MELYLMKEKEGGRWSLGEDAFFEAYRAKSV